MESVLLKSWKKVFEGDLSVVMGQMESYFEKPAVICLTGELGAGKTTICKKLAKNDSLQSTSYSLVAETSRVAYADLYRIEDPHELDELELDLYLENKVYFLCEWGKKFKHELVRLCGRDKKFYELVITINESKEKSSRNYSVYKWEL